MREELPRSIQLHFAPEASEDYETKQAKEEAARALSNFSYIGLFALSEGTSLARTRQKFIKFLAEKSKPKQ
eukprot:CAMPEP_0198734810 /NCGR_PEP_ID=MMETSP1475-20131203/55330_1 /TAXON_ID= ORGANISM="Unidentified sp., Strain CCMP1999" /NCGR_SAMPLE_ID=MMETSP1475 /ASSEMBLY_ACC=CAM_ASM_001111 /LENGTH=70 /DNA_ID=CAMNT_0044498357 /DNA_START=155 /DNA_END=367 /DNA_ORIENTATION=-